MDEQQETPAMPKGWKIVNVGEVESGWECVLENPNCGQMSGYGKTRDAAIRAAIAEIDTGDEDF